MQDVSSLMGCRLASIAKFALAVERGLYCADFGLEGLVDAERWLEMLLYAGPCHRMVRRDVVPPLPVCFVLVEKGSRNWATEGFHRSCALTWKEVC